MISRAGHVAALLTALVTGALTGCQGQAPQAGVIQGPIAPCMGPMSFHAYTIHVHIRSRDGKVIASTVVQWPTQKTYRFELPAGDYVVKADNTLPAATITVTSAKTTVLPLVPVCL